MASLAHAESGLPSFVYEVLPHAGRDIRLFDLAWSEDKKMLQGGLKTVRLEMDIGYEALSYTWNGETPSVPILCNGQTLVITQSLNLALETLCKVSSPRRLWVDAVCINQADNDEKALQIPQMHLIYFAADQLIAWLGPSTEATDRAIDMAVPLLEILRPIEEPILDYAPALEKLGLPNPDDIVWKGLGDLLTRGWHSRLWVLQEFAAARKASVTCGSRAADSEIMQNLFSQLRRTGLGLKISTKDKKKVSGYTSFRKINYNPLVFTTYVARHRECSEPVDKIYAIRALCNSLKSVRVDYSEASRKQYWKLYVQVGQLLLLEEPRLETLRTVGMGSRSPDIPSWCPDFNSAPSRQLLGGDFNAGGPCLEGSESSHLASSRDMRRVYLQGFAIDSFIQLSDPFPVIEAEDKLSKRTCTTMSEWLHHCLDSLAPYSKRDGEGPGNPSEAFLRAIFCTSGYTHAFDIHELTRRYRLARLFLEFKGNGQYLTEERIQSQLEISHALESVNDIKNTCEGRRFGLTRQGHMGLAPKGIREEDLLCVFPGTAHPFVLRPVHGSDTHELIGEIYVHGIMHGELFQNGRLQNDADSRVFIIE